MEALESAVLCGISPLEFWELTPCELNLMIKTYSEKKKEESKEKLTLAYINAMWTVQWLGKKSSHPKPLKEILEKIGNTEKKEMTDEQMLAVVQKLNTMFGGEVRVIGKE